MDALALLELRSCRQFLDQQRLSALGHDGQRGGDLGGRNVVLCLVGGDQVAEGRDVLGLEGLGDLLGELAQAQGVDGLGGGQVHLLHRLAGGLLDGTQQVLLPRRHEQDGVAGAACTAGAADAVHVGLGVVRDVVVDHVADALDVQAAGGDVGGDQDVDLAVLQRLDGALTLLLRDVAVDGGGLEAAGLAACRPGPRWPSWCARRR